MSVFVVVVELLSSVWLFAIPWTAACQASLSFIISWSLLRFVSIELVMPSNHLILCHHLSSCPPQSFPASGSFPVGLLFALGGQSYWSFSISHSNEYSGLISFRIDWFDLLAVQGTLKSLLQHHSLKASFVWYSAFFNGPTLTSICDYWKKHSFDYMDLCRQGDASAFYYDV